MVRDEHGHWQTVYVDCGPSKVSAEERPASVYGRKRGQAPDDEARAELGLQSSWIALNGYDDDPTADEAIRNADRTTEFA